MLGTDLEPLASYPGIRHDRHFACVWKKAQMMIIDDKEKERLIRGPWDANCSHLDIDELVRISDDMVKTMGSYLRQLKWQPPL